MCFHQSNINQWRSIWQRLRPGREGSSCVPFCLYSVFALPMDTVHVGCEALLSRNCTGLKRHGNCDSILCSLARRLVHWDNDSKQMKLVKSQRCCRAGCYRWKSRFWSVVNLSRVCLGSLQSFRAVQNEMLASSCRHSPVNGCYFGHQWSKDPCSQGSDTTLISIYGTERRAGMKSA